MRILFVSASNIFDPFISAYEVNSAGQLPSLQVAAAVLDNANLTPPKMVFIGPDMPLPEVIQFIRTYSIKAHLANIRWLVISNPTTHFMANELNGIAKIIPQSRVSAATLAAAAGVRRAKSKHTLFASAINVKGGTGKTTMLTNLADALARRGLRTVLIDADVVDGDVSPALGVPRSTDTIDNLAGQLSQSGSAGNALVKQFLYKRAQNLYIIPAPGRSDYRQDYLNELTVQLLLNAVSAARFDVVLIDLPGHLRSTPFTQALARRKTSEFFVLYHPEKIFEREGFSRALQVLQGLKAQNKASVIAIGSEGGTAWTSDAATALEKQTGLSVVAFLPHDPLVRQAQLHGRSVYELLDGKIKRRLGNKGSLYATAIEGLADDIVLRYFGGDKS